MEIALHAEILAKIKDVDKEDRDEVTPPTQCCRRWGDNHPDARSDKQHMHHNVDVCAAGSKDRWKAGLFNRAPYVLDLERVFEKALFI